MTSEVDPLPAVGAKKMQLLPRRNGADALADGRRKGAGDPHDDLARRQFSGIGGDALDIMLTGAVEEGFGADPLDRFHREVERDTTGDIVVRNDKILGADS